MALFASKVRMVSVEITGGGGGDEAIALLRESIDLARNAVRDKRDIKATVKAPYGKATITVTHQERT